MKKTFAIWFTLCLMCAGSVFAAVPQQINYQGYLTDTGGSPLDTTIAMTFNLYTDSTAGSLLWTETRPSVAVTEGLFNDRLGQLTALDDAVFNNSQIWLGITVGDNSEMTPRSRIVSVGYAYRVGTVDGASGGTITSDVNIVGRGNIGAGNINSGTMAFVTGENNRALGGYSVVAGGGGPYPSQSNSAIGDNSAIGGGSFNTASGGWATVAGGWKNNASNQDDAIGGGQANNASGGAATVGGGYSNNASGSNATIGGGNSNSASNWNATIGGGQQNTASGERATVGGGSPNTARGAYSVVSGGGGADLADSNSAIGDYSVVGGGRGNSARDTCATVGGGYMNKADTLYATVGGGASNIASDPGSTIGGGTMNRASAWVATIPGGHNNVASGSESTVGGGGDNTASNSNATVGGGAFNLASGPIATVGGGAYDTASGYAATIAGGYSNTASGAYSFAAGRRAKANYQGSFVWGDSYNADFADSNTNQFRVRATGGVWMFTSANNGARLPAGTTAWVAISDSTKKTDIRPVDTRAVLDKVAQLPITEWRYKEQPNPSFRHVGPMAQDFWKLFHLGEDSLGISTIDPDGIALAAIQELQKQNEELRTAVRRYAEELKELRGLVEKMAVQSNQENPKATSAAFSRNTGQRALKEITQ